LLHPVRQLRDASFRVRVWVAYWDWQLPLFGSWQPVPNPFGSNGGTHQGVRSERGKVNPSSHRANHRQTRRTLVGRPFEVVRRGLLGWELPARPEGQCGR
jgi:hypothetical protein